MRARKPENKESEPRATVDRIVANSLAIAGRSMQPASWPGCCVREAAITTVWLLLRVGGTGRATGEGLLCKGLSLAAAFAY